MKDIFQIAVLFMGIIILTGFVSGKSYFFPTDGASILKDGKYEIHSPKDKIVILYTPGSQTNNMIAECGHAAYAPNVILELQGKKIDSKEILVHGYCPQTVGNLKEGMSMSEARAPELEEIVLEYQKQGVPAKQIFVAGHSMGGWAAILVGARQKVEIAGFIAFAPANGVWVAHKRKAMHWAAVKRQTTAVEHLTKLDGQLFMFEGDPFNAPRDLAHMKNIRGIEYYTVSRCSSEFPHMLHRDNCFKDKYSSNILKFIEKQVNGMAFSQK